MSGILVAGLIISQMLMATGVRLRHTSGAGPLLYVNRTPCHIACTDVNTVSTQHIALICCTLKRGSSCAFLKIVIPSLVPHHVSRPAQYTQHFDLIFTVSSAHRLRLKVDHVGNALRRFTRP